MILNHFSRLIQSVYCTKKISKRISNTLVFCNEHGNVNDGDEQLVDRLIDFNNMSTNLFFLCLRLRESHPFKVQMNNFRVNIYQTLLARKMRHKHHFFRWVYQIWIQSPPFASVVTIQSLKRKVCPTIYWTENTWINNFPNGISVMWKATSFVQDLDSICWYYWWRSPLPNERVIFYVVAFCESFGSLLYQALLS